MIRIDKGAAPTQLGTSAGPVVASMRTEYEADPDAYRTGRTKFAKRANIYGSPSVRKALAFSHHGKCCYCETYVQEPYAHRHVEHFRPAAYSQQTNGSPAIRPGYYWLTYDWDNLLLSCTFCNSSNKRNLFPLLDPATRAVGHAADIGLETPLLLKPDSEDPEPHMEFRRDVPFGVTDKGRTTVEVVGLDSPKHEARKAFWDLLLKMRMMLLLALEAEQTPKQQQIVEHFRSMLQRSVDPAGSYSAMAKRFLKDHPIPR